VKLSHSSSFSSDHIYGPPSFVSSNSGYPPNANGASNQVLSDAQDHLNPAESSRGLPFNAQPIDSAADFNAPLGLVPNSQDADENEFGPPSAADDQSEDDRSEFGPPSSDADDQGGDDQSEFGPPSSPDEAGEDDENEFRPPSEANDQREDDQSEFGPPSPTDDEGEVEDNEFRPPSDADDEGEVDENEFRPPSDADDEGDADDDDDMDSAALPPCKLIFCPPAPSDVSAVAFFQMSFPVIDLVSEDTDGDDMSMVCFNILFSPHSFTGIPGHFSRGQSYLSFYPRAIYCGVLWSHSRAGS
jgi:hypothetical protein